MVYTMPHMLQDEMDTSSKNIYPEAMEEWVCYQEDTIKQFGDIIAWYQSWYQYVTKNHQVEVSLVLPQTLES